MSVNPNDLDLNLLRVFNQIMMDRSVSRVARTLGVSQPAVSNALKRLRVLLGDELFLRTAQGMQPTPLAEQIAEPIASAIETIRAAIGQQPVFDPALARRSFTVATHELGELYLLPRLLSHVAQEAPEIRLVSSGGDPQTLKDDLESGRADIAVGAAPQLQGGYFRQRLFKDTYVLAFRKGHPLDGRKAPSAADVAEQTHVVVASSGLDATEIDQLLQHQGITRRTRATVSHVTAIAAVLAATDLVAILPAGVVGLLSLASAPLPFTAPDHSADIYWHARLHRDPANQWLRRRIFDLFGGTSSAGR